MHHVSPTEIEMHVAEITQHIEIHKASITALSRVRNRLREGPITHGELVELFKSIKESNDFLPGEIDHESMDWDLVRNSYRGDGEGVRDDN